MIDIVKAWETWSLPSILEIIKGMQGTRMQAWLFCIQPSLLNYNFISAVGPGSTVAASRGIGQAVYTDQGNRLGMAHWESLHVIIRIITPTSTCLSQVTHPACIGSPFPSEYRAPRCLQGTVKQGGTWLTKAMLCRMTTLLSANVW